MNLIFKISILILSILIFKSCTNNDSNILNESEVMDSPEILYSEAMKEFKSNNLELAITKFNDIELRFPLSNEAIQSQIMSGFIEYLKLNYNEAIFKFSRVINKYPSYKNIDYVYYMRAMCYYEQIENENLDGKYNLLALENFEQTINRFPNSSYAKDSSQKIVLIKENIAAKHMNIALFYLKRKNYLAAIKRYNKVVNEYSKSKFAPESLHRLVEIYYTLGMLNDAKKTAAVLGYNYPKSKWYKYSYNLLEDNSE